MSHSKVLSLGIVLLTAALAWGQRAQSAAYDSDRKVKFSGIVTRIDWVNPGAFFFVNVKDSIGTVENWAVEFGNPFDLEKDGWKSTSLHIGDAVNVEGSPARGPARQALATSVILAKTGAKLFVPSNKPVAKLASAPAPRWPNGHVRLGPAPGKKGYWGAPSSTVLVEETGAKIPMNRDGTSGQHRRCRQSRALPALGESRLRIPPAHPFQRRSLQSLHAAEAAFGIFKVRTGFSSSSSQTSIVFSF